MDDHEISGMSAHIYMRQDNQKDQHEDKFKNLSKFQSEIEEKNKKLFKENEKLKEKVAIHESMLKEIQKDKKRIDEHESLLKKIQKEDKIRDGKIRIQERGLKKAVLDESKRAENFEKEFKEISEEIGRTKKAIEEMHTEVEQMSNDSKTLSNQINKRFDEVQASQKHSENILIDKLDALEARQTQHFSEIESKQQKMLEMVRIIQAMRNIRMESDNGRYFANIATAENEKEEIPEELQTVVEDALDENIKILGQQPDISRDDKSGFIETIKSESNQSVKKSIIPLKMTKNPGIPPLPSKK